MVRTNSSWSLFYLGVAIFGAFGGHMCATRGPIAVPTAFLVFGALVGFVFTFVSAFGGLWKRFGSSRDRSVLEVSLWASSPTNPQSNRLSQVVFFASIGITAIFESRCPVNQSVGFLPLAMAIGIALALLLFRRTYGHRLHQLPQSIGEKA